nr:hypothetical protein [Bordetella pertussis]
MNTHKHARLTFLRRLEMVQQLIAHQVCVPEAARAPPGRQRLSQGVAGASANQRPRMRTELKHRHLAQNRLKSARRRTASARAARLGKPA